MAKDLTTTISNWINGASAGQTKYVQGIEGTTVDPTQLAIRAQAALIANFNQAVTSGRWANRLAAAGKAKWQAEARCQAQKRATRRTPGGADLPPPLPTC